MYIFSDYAWFWFVWVLLAELYDSSQVIGERVTLRAMWIKEDSKGGPKWPNKGTIRSPNRSIKRAQNAAEQERTDRTEQCPPRADRGAHHGPWWEAHGRASCTHGRAWQCCCGFLPFSRDCSFSGRFCWCLPNIDVPRPIQDPNSFHSILHSINLRLKLFRERKRKRRRTARNPLPGFAREIQERFFGWANSVPSPLFLISSLCFVILIWIFVVLMLNLCMFKLISPICCWFCHFWVCWPVLLISRF